MNAKVYECFMAGQKKSKASKKDWACEGEGAAAFSNAMASLEKHDQEDTR